MRSSLPILMSGLEQHPKYFSLESWVSTSTHHKSNATYFLGDDFIDAKQVGRFDSVVQIIIIAFN